MSHSVHGTFVSEKINKIRWRPDTFNNNSHFFVTGSVDANIGSIKLWDFNETEEDDDIYPFLITSLPFDGDVTEIKFLNPDYLIASSTSGSVCLVQIVNRMSQGLKLDTSIAWKHLHKFENGEKSPCTAFTINDNDVVTVGEDGQINLLNAFSPTIVKTIENADSCSIHCVAFIKHNEVLTSNLRGQLKIWDLRSKGNKPTTTFTSNYGYDQTSDQGTTTCLTFHPSQRHLIIAGNDLGSLTTWDLRHSTYPVNLLNAHEGSISEIQFHPDHPDQLFSCSSAGEIWHWATKTKPSISLLNSDEFELNPWLAPETVKNKLEVFTLMPTLGKPINSLDLNRNKVLCGCDTEAIYLINGIAL